MERTRYILARHRFVTMLLCYFVALFPSHAVPARPGQVRTITLADGTMIQVQLVGDEHGHYWVAADGRAFRQHTYSLSTAEDWSEDSFYTEVNLAVEREALVRRAKANANRAMKVSRKAAIGHFGEYIGEKKGIIILVNFQDKSFNATNDQVLFNRIANEAHYTTDRFIGSVHDYFYDQSNGLFDLTFDVVGPVTVQNNMSYYGRNGSDDNDLHPAEMVIEACKLVDEEVNFADYDWDEDGMVDQVYVIYAGKGEADGGAANTIWPHEWELSEAAEYGDGEGAFELDGVTIDTYACGSELNGGGRICGIGTMCHEFSHCLGFPDFYDIDYSGGVGMDAWDIMSGGSYNGNGDCPAGYTSYERWMAGWLQPVELKEDTTVVGMKSLQEGGDAYIIYNDGHPDEYYLFENRQQVAWDEELPAHGLLIVHVDFDLEIWENNQPNDNPRHQRMTWVPADGKIETYRYGGSVYVSEEGMKSDLYPYGDNNRFTNISYPAATLYNANTDGSKLLNKSVIDIAEGGDGTISFSFLNKAMEKLDPELAFDVDSVSVEAGIADFSAPELYNPYDLDVTFSSSNMSLATVDATSGIVAIGETPGTVTITANYDGDEFYKSGTASYVINITVPSGIESISLSHQAEQSTAVYDITGRRVAANNESEISSLPQGVYIVNGHKVIIR